MDARARRLDSTVQPLAAPALRAARRANAPVLVVLAASLFAVSLVFDAIGLIFGDPAFSLMGLRDLEGGVVAFAVAGVFALVPLTRPPRGSREDTLALSRAGLCYSALALAACALALRGMARAEAPGPVALVLTGLALGCGIGSGYVATLRA
jgi:uncharacterized membrane protein